MCVCAGEEKEGEKLTKRETEIRHLRSENIDTIPTTFGRQNDGSSQPLSFKKLVRLYTKNILILV